MTQLYVLDFIGGDLDSDLFCDWNGGEGVPNDSYVRWFTNRTDDDMSYKSKSAIAAYHKINDWVKVQFVEEGLELPKVVLLEVSW